MKFIFSFFKQKRGLSQVDWAISLGIFMLFLVWFFMFAAPSFSAPETSDSLTYIIEQGLNDYKWNVYRTPIFLVSNQTYGSNVYEPFFASLYLTNNLNYTIYSDKLQKEIYFQNALEGIVFLYNSSLNNDQVWIVGSTEEYFVENDFYDLSSSMNKISIKNYNFFVDFVSGYPEKLLFNYDTRVDNIDYYVGGVAIEELDEAIYSTSPLFSLYKSSTNSFNMSQFVFANNPGLYNFIDVFDLFGNELDFKLDMDIYNYDNYFLNNSAFGNLDYENTICENFTNSFINFYDEDGGFVLIFSKPVLLEFCLFADESSNGVNLEISSKLTNNFNYKYVFYEGDYSRAFDFIGMSEVKSGVSENLYGLNLEKMMSLKSRNVDLKEIFMFPTNNDFQIIIKDALDEEELLNIQSAQIDSLSNVYAKEYSDFILDEFGKMRRVIVNVLTW